MSVVAAMDPAQGSKDASRRYGEGAAVGLFGDGGDASMVPGRGISFVLRVSTEVRLFLSLYRSARDLNSDGSGADPCFLLPRRRAVDASFLPKV